MKAAYIEQPGPVENTHYGDLSLPRLYGHEVLVRMDAVTVNHKARIHTAMPFSQVGRIHKL